jgi:LacI family transcriptional regulator
VRRITISDVAAAAGVSIKTVSRVINREPNVRPSVRLRVQAVIQELGFVPNMAARSLAGTRSFMIGTLFDNPSPSYVVAIQRGAMAACRAAGYHLAIEEMDLRGDVAAQMRAMLATARLDGVILSPPVTDCAAVLDALEAKGLPYVRLMPAEYPSRSPAVVVDDTAAAVDLARHLWQLNHRDFAVITGPPGHVASRLRLDGFLAGVAACGGDPTRVRVVGGDFTFQAGMAAGLALLDGPARPTAIFAGNDEMAAGVYSAAAQLGVRIPDQVSVVGYDDSPIAELLWPTLTTVRQPVAEMAAAAARILLGGGADDPAPVQRLGYQVVIRQSTAQSRPVG